MNPYLIDTHSHLHFGAYDKDREAVLLRMRQDRIMTITVGTNAVTSKTAIHLAEKEQIVFASVGYHPSNLTSLHGDDNEERDPNPYALETLESLVSSSKRVVAIGETGLDYHHIDPNLNVNEAKELQKSVFRDQLTLANEKDLPVIVHCRDAFDECLEIIRDAQFSGINVRAVMHCFSGTWEQAERALNAGLYISFTGNVTFRMRASDDPDQHVHRVVERVPEDRYMLETDAPWLAPDPHRGERNEPAYVKSIAMKVAELRGTSVEEIAQCTTRTAEAFFNLPAST